MSASRLILTAAALAAAAPAAAASPEQVAEAKAMLGKAVSFKSFKGSGQVQPYAEWLAGQFRAAGFAAEDVTVTPVGDTATLTVRLRGTGTKPPIVVTGHLDVVPADPKDWTRDPYTMTEDGPYLFGRGVEDNKFDVTMVSATAIAMKRAGYKGPRDIYLMFSGDEETDGATAKLQAQAAKAANAELMLNSDGGGGELNTQGQPVGYSVQGAEKSYADFRIEFTNPGGHSSAPRPDNAINKLAAAAMKIAAYQFPYEANDWTRGSFAALGKATPGPVGEAMIAFAKDPRDKAAADAIAANPMYVGQLRTTCIATQVEGGHAPNALPQRAWLNINCRIFPGTSVPQVQAKLAELIGDKDAKITTEPNWTDTPASPMRPDVMSAVKRVVDARYPGTPVVPGMSSGATDSVAYRALGIPSYGTSALFMKPEDSYAHGLNERVPTSQIPGALDQWRALLTEMAK